MDEEVAAKLQEIFCRKMQEVFGLNTHAQAFGARQLEEFNAWQDYLRFKLGLAVVDIEEGEKPGFVRIKGRVAGIRLTNPSNGPGYSKEFVIVPTEIANKVLMLGHLPDELPSPSG